jgi:endonuclease/exonuclease/phosphatase family metal-dependent hydrolase
MKTEKSAFLKVATYNIHKGVQGFGPARRLEIHNLGLAIEQLDADTSGIGLSCRKRSF